MIFFKLRLLFLLCITKLLHIKYFEFFFLLKKLIIYCAGGVLKIYDFFWEIILRIKTNKFDDWFSWTYDTPMMGKLFDKFNSLYVLLDSNVVSCWLYLNYLLNKFTILGYYSSLIQETFEFFRFSFINAEPYEMVVFFYIRNNKFLFEIDVIDDWRNRFYEGSSYFFYFSEFFSAKYTKSSEWKTTENYKC